MRYTVINDVIVPRLGMGIGALPQNEYTGEVDMKTSMEIVDECMRNGVTYFDVGYYYLQGKAEDVFRELVAERYMRESFILADKIPLIEPLNSARVEEIFNEELRKCGVDYFDFYYGQQLDEITWENAENAAVFPFMIEKKKEGVVKNIGASIHGEADLLRMFLEKYGCDIDFVQLELNYMDWYGKRANELHKIACEYNKPVIVMSPLRGGFLVNLYSERVRNVFEEAKAENNRSYTELALGFVNSKDNIACILSGMDKKEYVEQNAHFLMEESLSETEIKKMEEAGSMMLKEAFVNCTGCNYCDRCVQKIKIPQILDLFNKNVIAARNIVYEIFPDIEKRNLIPHPCIECHECERRCPQKLSIVTIIKRCSDHCARGN